MWKKRMIQTAFIIAGLFICLNTFLLIYHEDSIYERKAYVSDWNSIPLRDLRETTAAEGVFQPAEETIVYLDPSQGEYIQTLAEENDEVEEGTPLIEYQLHDFEETERNLQAQLDQTTAELAAVEATLAQLEASLIQEEEEESLPFETEEPSSDVETDVETEPENDSTAYLQEQFRLETEQKAATLEAEQARLQTELEQLTENQASQVLSPVTGVVKKIESQDGTPVITISSSELVIEGRLTEEVRKQTEPGMDVKINGVETNGVIAALSEFPEEDSAAESIYPFQVSLENEEENLESVLPGYHTKMTIILDEQLDVPAVHDSQLTNTLTPAVWLLEESGVLVYREVETGIKSGSWTAVLNGAEAGEVAAASSGNLTNDSLFVTPIDTSFIDWSRFNNKDSALIQRSPLLAGLLHR